ncbi:MAG: hypothetical protein JO108_23015 [Acidobacteriaceae bacterium]|nr:hypothetical protein [Acidobacteriaceae bacterium]
MATEARVKERVRIERELHDNLLQTVHGFMLHLQGVIETMPPPAATNKLEKSLDIGDARSSKAARLLRSRFNRAFRTPHLR